MEKICTKQVRALLLFALTAIPFAGLAQSENDSFDVGNMTFQIISDNSVSITGGNLTDPNFVIPSEVTYDNKAYKVAEVGLYAFRDNEYIERITIPNGVTLREGAFFGCGSLKEVVFDNATDTVWISLSVFGKCKNLERIVNIPPLSSINDYAFGDCEKLTGDIRFPYIGLLCSTAFSGSYFTTITIDSVALADRQSFYDCPKLETVIINAADQMYALPEKCPNLKCFVLNVPEVPYPDVINPMTQHPQVSECFLFVPKESLAYYRANWPSKDPKNESAFKYILPLEDYYSGAYKDWTAIKGIHGTEQSTKSFYSLDGKRIHNAKKGIFIIKDGNGKTTKSMIK